jgi:hypothetical protein
MNQSRLGPQLGDQPNQGCCTRYQEKPIDPRWLAGGKHTGKVEDGSYCRHDGQNDADLGDFCHAFFLCNFARLSRLPAGVERGSKVVGRFKLEHQHSGFTSMAQG